MIWGGCHETSDEPTIEEGPTLFTLLPPEQTKIDFRNKLTDGLNTNTLVYEYFYNGGGVATGDLNGDDLIDIYFSANMSENKMYINNGDMHFQDVTAVSGAGGRTGPWKTGVAMVDINGDGKLDIYLCYSGMMPELKRVNQLFINQGNDAEGIPTFLEKATEYGLASAAFSNHTYFFDYDRDGDLDMLLLNHNPKNLPIYNEKQNQELLKGDDPFIGIRLFNQSNGHFEDVTMKAGISSSALTYGLGIGISDFNNDGWADFYITNDYAVPDYLYMNNQNGTFTNRLQESVRHNTLSAMGNDVADVNNDGLQDILTLDMLPEDNFRQKLLLSPENYEQFDLNVRSGFHYQYMRNMLQLNNGNGTFSEIGQMAGISNTDWSWSALLADYNNDGWKDLHITNGYLKDFTNLDFITFMNDFVKSKGRMKREDVLELLDHMPESDVVNYIYENEGGLSFSNRTKSWGINFPSNSNGAAYADLDNDGDLDLIVNNINKPAFIYQNESQKTIENNYLQIELKGIGLNMFGIGAIVVISSEGKKQLLEQYPSRGYKSSVSPILHFGLGKLQKVDSLLITWVSGKQQLVLDIEANQRIELNEEEAMIDFTATSKSKPIFKETTPPFDHQNLQLRINDFNRQPLLISEFSFSGPCMVKGDVNGDGLEDVYVGGAFRQSAALYLQQANGKFLQKTVPAFEDDKTQVDADVALFDANGDEHLDIYIASGGYHNFQLKDPLLQDRLYINDGNGNFVKSENALPEMLYSKACVAVNDVNQDGYLDLFIGSRVVPGHYPETPHSYLLINDGKGQFTDQIVSIAPDLQNHGMITDAVWADLDQDDVKELIVVGEWMPVSVFQFENDKLKNKSLSYFDKEYKGWWNTIEVGDLNNDQRPDLIVGNIGTNTQFQVSNEEPVEMYYDDFDNNGAVDPLFCYYIQGGSYPYVTRNELLRQSNTLASKFPNHESYANASIQDILSKKQLKAAGHLTANYMKTSCFLNLDGKFKIQPLPVETQFAPVYTITLLDYNKDGNQDMLLCGNNDHLKLRIGKMDANYGVLFEGDGKGGFQYINQSISGFKLKGDVRSVIELNGAYLFGINQAAVVSYEYN